MVSLGLLRAASTCAATPVIAQAHWGRTFPAHSFDFRQYFAKHSYLELSIPAGPNETFLLEPNYLHIWPRGEFMLIALANLVSRFAIARQRSLDPFGANAGSHAVSKCSQDKSFTLTLFAHDSTFSSIDAQLASSDSSNSNGSNPVVELFRKEFPDALEHMGEEALLRSWKENPKDGLITVEVCSVALSAAMMRPILLGEASR